MKRYLILAFWSVLFVSAMFVIPCKAQGDENCVTTTRGLLEERKSGFRTTWLQKSNRELGDAAAIALPKIFSKKELVKRENLKLFLPIIREAFEDTEMIIEKGNLRPVFTLKLLNSLRSKVNTYDAALRREISETLDFVKKQTSK